MTRFGGRGKGQLKAGELTATSSPFRGGKPKGDAVTVGAGNLMKGTRVQLDLRKLPKGAGDLGRGLLQFFFCREDDCADFGRVSSRATGAEAQKG